MHAVIRSYTGVPGLGRRLSQRRKDIEKTMQKATGFMAYYLVDTPDGTISLTICRSKEGTEESNRLAAGWLRENMPDVAQHSPQISSGDVVIDVSGVHATH